MTKNNEKLLKILIAFFIGTITVGFTWLFVTGILGLSFTTNESVIFCSIVSGYTLAMDPMH